MLSKIVKIDDSINDITDLKTNKIKWNTFNEFIIIPNVYEFTIEEKAELWWNWYYSREYALYKNKRKYM